MRAIGGDSRARTVNADEETGCARGESRTTGVPDSEDYPVLAAESRADLSAWALALGRHAS